MVNGYIPSMFGLAEPAPHATGSTVQRVHDSLRRRIITLDLLPGTTLSRSELTKTYNVSQTPIREAMQLLRQEGLVQILPQSKTFVSQIDLKQISEVHFLRVALETEVVRVLAADPDSATLTRARSIVKMQEALIDDPDQMPIFQDLDEAFHQALFAGIGRGGLHQLLRERSGHLSRVRRLHLPEKGPTLEVLKCHREILDAVADRDPAAAVQAMRYHLGQTIARIDGLRARFPAYFS